MTEPESPVHPDLARLGAREPSALADRISHLLHPAVVVPVVMLLVSVGESPTVCSALEGAGWAVLAALFCAGLPFLLLVVLARRGVVSDRQVVRREQRMVLLVPTFGLVLAGAALLWWWGAPRPLLALVVACLLGVLSAAAITLVWKISFHSAAIAAAVAYLPLTRGPLWWLAAVPLVVLVCWARIRAGRHSVAQALAGVALGMVVAVVSDLLVLG